MFSRLPTIKKFLIQQGECLNKLKTLARCSKKITQNYCRINFSNNGFCIIHEGVRFFDTRGVELEDYLFSIDEKTYYTYLQNKIGKSIELTRYFLNYKNHVLRLNEYDDDLKGLCNVEIDLLIEESTNFLPPKWFGQEITKDKRFKIYNLATKGNPLIYEDGFFKD